jgi:transcription initiation factor TFIIIB Brf1 subunit/transcription initiation factor TFIIB
MSTSEFALFDQMLEEYKKIKVSDEEKELSESDECTHENIINEKGMSVCVDCGEEMQYKNTHDKEWRYYGQGDTKNSSDPNRVQMRKSEERNIFKDVENLGFSDKVVARANKIYAQVTKGKIFRGNSRRAIVFASIFHSFKLGGHPQSHERLIRIFNLNRKTGLRGLKYVNLYAPKDSKIRTTYISPVNLVEEILEQFSATKDQKQEVIDLYEKIRNKSSRLNRSRPQSVSSGLVFYWTCLKGKNISLKEFAKKVQLSELTISKISREISDVLECEHIS